GGDRCQGGTDWTRQRRSYRKTFATAALLAGIAPLFGFGAIAMGLVGYVTALFKLSAVLTVLWGWLFLKERSVHHRLLGALVMVVGGAVIALGSTRTRNARRVLGASSARWLIEPSIACY